MRIKFTQPEAAGFELDMGFALPPYVSLSSVENHHVKIDPVDREYSLSRLHESTITYLSLGSKPSESYKISLEPKHERLSKFWPENVSGIPDDGALFDSVTRKMLPKDADVTANHKYYILTRKPVKNCKDVSINKICTSNFSDWNVYEVSASSMSHDAALFFWDYHCRLCENTAEIIPLWPVHIDTPYVLKYDTDYSRALIFYLRGQADLKAFPDASISRNGSVFSVNCNSRQQLLAAGRTSILRYMYIWRDKESLARETQLPKVIVRDSDGQELHEGKYPELPKGKFITLTPEFDGTALVLNRNIIVERYSLKAGTRTKIAGLRMGCSVEIFQGLDLVWQAEYKRSDSEHDVMDRELLSALEKCCGEVISIPHALGALVSKMNNYPLTKSWLERRVRNGRMSQRACKILVHHFSGGKP